MRRLLIITVLLLLGLSFSCSKEDSWDKLKEENDKLSHQGMYQEATIVAKKKLDIAERSFDAKHPNRLISLNDLALLYVRQGRYAEAEPLYKKSLEILEKKGGPDHPAVAINLEMLAGVDEKLGKYEQAVGLYKRSLAIWEKKYGLDNPTVANTKKSIEKLYKKRKSGTGKSGTGTD